jgi:hypothetical protein
MAEHEALEQSTCAEAQCVSAPRFLADENLSVLLVAQALLIAGLLGSERGIGRRKPDFARAKSAYW